MRKLLAFFVLSVFCIQALAAVDLAKDSFDIYRKSETTSFDYRLQANIQYRFAPKQKIVLLSGDVITPIVYDDIDETITPILKYSQDFTGNIHLKFDRVDIRPPVNALNSGSEVNAGSYYDQYEGDFNGDGANDLLYFSKTGFTSYLVESSFIVFGHKNSSRNIERVDFYQRFGGFDANAQAVNINVRDYNQDGITDIAIQPPGQEERILYIGQDGVVETANKGALDYSYLPRAVKPNNGSLTPGSTNIDFRVAENGAATYALNVDAPAGPGGIRPDVTLTYNSGSAGNGVAGIGWNLAAGSVIIKCGTTIETEGYTSRPDMKNLSDWQTFCLDGSKLIAVPGYPNEFRTEISSSSKITFNRAGIVGRDYNTKASSFTVKRKDGTTWQYSWQGESNGLGGNQEKILGAWQLTRISDNVGNYITYHYLADDKTLVDYIRYGRAKIQFVYNRRADSSEAYFSGVKFTRNKRLSEIQVWNKNENIKRYHMEYGHDQSNKFSRLEYIQECGKLNGSMLCKEPIQFKWNDVAGSNYYLNSYRRESRLFEYYVPGGSWHNAPDQEIKKKLTGDFDGDGFQDFLFFNGANDTSFYLHGKNTDNGDRYVRSEVLIDGSNYFNYHISQNAAVVDVNSDGKSDLITLSRNYVKLYVNQTGVDGNEIKFKQFHLKTINYKYDRLEGDIRVVDVDNDGVNDFVFTYNYRKDKHQKYFSLFSFDDSDKYLVSGNYPVGDVKEIDYSHIDGHITLRLSDFNGDGYQDRYKYHHKNIREPRIELFDGSRYPLPFNSSQANLDKINIFDINADGLADLIFPGALYINTGKGFTNKISIPGGWKADKAQPLDFNMDGKTDLLVVDNSNNYKLLISSGYSLEMTDAPAFLPKHNDKISIVISDMTGDGISDFTVFNDKKSSVTYAHRVDSWDKSLKGEVVSYSQIVEMRSSGVSNKTAYKSLNAREDSVYHHTYNDDVSAFSGQSTVSHITGPQKVVSQVSSGAPIFSGSSGVNFDEITVSYRYEGLKVQAGGRGSLGFRVLSTIDHSSGVVTTTEYAQEFPYTGMPYATSKIRYSSEALHGDLGFTEIIGQINLQRIQKNSASSSNLQTAQSLNAKSIKTSYNWWQPTACSRHFRTSGKPSGSGKTIKDSVFENLLSCSVNRIESHAVVIGNRDTKYANSYFPYSSGNSEFNFRPEDGQGTYASRTFTDYYTAASNGNFSADPRVINVGTMELAGSGWTSESVKNNRPASSQFNSHYQTRTTNEYTDNDYVKWHLGRITKTTVVHKRNGTEDITRTSSFDYYNNGLLKTSIIEPDKPEFTVKTTYDYDTYGNQKSKVVTSHESIPATSKNYFKRKTSVTYLEGIYPSGEYSYLINGNNEAIRLVKKYESYNALGLPQYVYTPVTLGDNLNGAKKLTLEYDALGREIRRSDDVAGVLSTTNYRFCGGSNCPPIAYSYVEVNNTTAPDTRQYSDVMGQTVRSSKRQFDGSWAHVDTAFDLLGREVATSVPHKQNNYFAGGVTSNTTQYDWLNRPLVATHADGSSTTYNYTYDLLAIRQTHISDDANTYQQNSTTWKNALGETVKVVADNNKSVTQFFYDAQGNAKRLLTGVDGSGQIQVVNQFNVVGHKTKTEDPDKGTWEYQYNALGEITRQVTGNKKVTDTFYDGLGRIKNRKVYETYNAGNVSGLISDIEYSYDTIPGTEIPMLGALGKTTKVQDYKTGYYVSSIYKSSQQGYITDVSTETYIPGEQKYYQRTEFDKYGRVERSFDAAKLTSLNMNAIALGSLPGTQNIYNNYGYLAAVANSGSSGLSYEYYRVNTTDVFGNVTQATLGNGVKTYQHYDPVTGRLMTKGSQKGSSHITQYSYHFNDFGNLTRRDDAIHGTREIFGYTNLNQIASVSLEGFGIAAGADIGALHSGLKNQYIHTNRYDRDRPWQLAWTNRGTKGPSGFDNRSYVYHPGSNRLHKIQLFNSGSEVYNYDNNGNQISKQFKPRDLLDLTSGSSASSPLQDIRTVEYSYFDKPTRITQDAQTIEFDYGPGQNRTIRRDYENGTLKKTTRYIGSVEHITEADGSSYYKRMIAGVAVEITAGENQGIKYLHKDHIGSVVAVSDATGNVLERFSFDVYGKRRPVLNLNTHGSISPVVVLNDLLQATDATTNRGFTGHEMLDQVGLIHMNGRVYDPILGLFLSADPYIQSPSSALSTNRYSYVLNNPLSYTDPSGYFFKKVRNAFKRAVSYAGDRINQAGAWIDDNRTTLAIIAVSVFCGPACATWYYGALLGAASGYAQTGTLKGAVTGAVAGAITGGAAGYASGMNPVAQAAISAGAAAVAGGVRSVLQGGQFGDGFRQAGKGALVNFAGSAVAGQPSSFGGQLTKAVIVGGTASKVSGGKFENGAAFAAFSVAVSSSLKSRMQLHGGSASSASSSGARDKFRSALENLRQYKEFQELESAHGGFELEFDDSLEASEYNPVSGKIRIQVQDLKVQYSTVPTDAQLDIIDNLNGDAYFDALEEASWSNFSPERIIYHEAFHSTQNSVGIKYALNPGPYENAAIEATNNFMGKYFSESPRELDHNAIR
ncbi:RHS repeat-associated core domain-containing protein [Bacterioplanoides sp.]|uniref:RHS repeat-associated core domain-containing protein n=1 Tax=Bacterioplanoides sp. TaxID=2066072 RepID=UPI003B001663